MYFSYHDINFRPPFNRSKSTERQLIKNKLKYILPRDQTNSNQQWTALETFHEKLESRASASKRLKNFYSNSNKRRGRGSPFHLIYFFVLATFAQKLRPSLTSELRFLITAYPSERRDRIDNPSPPRQTFESVENFIKRERTRIWRRRRRNKEKWDIIRKYYKEESKSKLKFLYIYILSAQVIIPHLASLFSCVGPFLARLLD